MFIFYIDPPIQSLNCESKAGALGLLYANPNPNPNHNPNPNPNPNPNYN